MPAREVGVPEAGVGSLEVHKALADDTRFRLYRFLKLAGRPASVREMAGRLSLHENTLRPHLRRLEEAGLVVREVRRSAAVGRPQTMYTALEPKGEGGRDYRLFAEMLAGLVRGPKSLERARALAAEWGAYLVTQGGPKPGTRLPSRRNLAILQEAMAKAGFEPRFRRTGEAGDGGGFEVTLRDCPFRELADDHRELVCGLHRGLLEGMLGGLKPPLEMADFRPFAARGICRLTAAGPAGN